MRRLFPGHLVWLALVSVGLVSGCGQQAALPPPANNQAADPPAAGNQVPVPPVADKQQPDGCRVAGRIISTVWGEQGGGIERAIVSVWSGSERLEQAYGKGGQFQLNLKPGKYRLMCSANGTRGATFDVVNREVAIADSQDRLDLGDIDLPISKTTALYGRPAPELTGISDWQDTPPLVLGDLRGKVVVLDFFGYYCSICHEHKPDLVRLSQKYKDKGLVVLAVHDNSLKTLAEMNAKIDPILARVFKGNVPELPIALDGAGKNSVCEAYGIYAVPALIVIDPQGRVFRRYYHAGVPELDADVQKLLSAR
jgi:thiol-disulfide isomerase/thioredoxin